MPTPPDSEPLEQVPGFSLFHAEAQYLGPHGMIAVRGLTAQRFRRFSYGDIEALIVRPTSRQHVLTAILGTAFLLGGAMAAWGQGGIRLGGAGLAVVSLLLVVGNLALGPCCETFLQTRVQRYRLGNLGRRTRAERLRAMLWPRLEAHQRPLTTAELRAWAASRRAAELRRAGPQRAETDSPRDEGERAAASESSADPTESASS